MSRLGRFFRTSAARPVARQARLGVEALGERLVPSVTFTKDPSTPTLTIAAGQHQDNTVTVRNDGDGNLTVVADGVTRSFAHITTLRINTFDGKDTVTFNQGSAGHEADTHRSLNVVVNLGGELDSNDQDHFTANVFGDVGVFQNGAWQARSLDFSVDGGAAADRIDFNMNDVDVHTGSRLGVFAEGGFGNDNITWDSDGEVDGFLSLFVAGDAGDDTIAVNVLLDAGSTGTVGSDAVTRLYSATVTGDFGGDDLLFAIRQEAGSHASVTAGLDVGLYTGADVSRHTANVFVLASSEDHLIQ